MQKRKLASASNWPRRSVIGPWVAVWLAFACGDQGASTDSSGIVGDRTLGTGVPNDNNESGGDVNEPGGETALPNCLDAAGDPGPTVLRRLTRREYNNTVADLLRDDTAPAARWLAEPSESAFDNNAAEQAVTRQHVEQFRNTANAVAERAVTERLDQVAPCAIPGSASSAADCADTFIESFGLRAFRRPLTTGETAAFKQVYELGAESGGYEHGVELVLQTLLQSVQFLYLTELGTAGETGAMIRLSGWELASRLSYYLWATTPDAELLAAAETGELDAAAGVLKHAERLIDDPRAERVVEHFYGQWLRVQELPTTLRSPEAFPEFNQSVAGSMLAGMNAFVTDVSLNGSYQELMTSSFGYVDGLSAPIVGAAPPAGVGVQRVQLPADQRAGLLTEPAVLTAHSDYESHSPIARGVYIRESIMCSPPPPVPPGIAAINPEVDPALTTRERFELHRAEPACAACHSYFDAIGLGFENYDSIGRYRSEENGKTIDPSGEVVFYDGVDRNFTGAQEFAAILANSPEAQSCFVTQWFRFANGRTESTDDRCTLSHLNQGFEQAGFSIRRLLLEMTQTDAFLFRRPIAEEEVEP